MPNRFLNIAGPCNPADPCMLPTARRLQGIEELVQQPPVLQAHMTEEHDCGDGLKAAPGEWTFESKVDGFDAHIRRSVPLYEMGHDLICELSEQFVPATGGTCYELGSATGVLLGKLAQHHLGRNRATWVGVECVPEMVHEARRRIAHLGNARVDAGDLSEFELEKTPFVVAYLTVQFLRPAARPTLVRRIFDRLTPGGAFVLHEKIRAPNSRLEDVARILYDAFKRAQGFTTAQIQQKARSLAGVLEPLTTEQNLALLRGAGFTDVMTVFKHTSFECYLAIK